MNVRTVLKEKMVLFITLAKIRIKCTTRVKIIMGWGKFLGHAFITIK